VRVACARLAALRRWRPNDDAALAKAERDLVVAHAAALARKAAAMLTGAVS